jgi:hypothetical protein
MIIWRWIELIPHTLPGVLALAAFLTAAFYIRIRRDSRSCFEFVCVAWQLTICDLALGLVDSFEYLFTSDSSPSRLDFVVSHYDVVVMRLIVPVALTIPIFWWVLRSDTQVSLGKTRLFVISTAIAFLDLLIYLWVFPPRLVGYL